jgi:hypothetical protein
VGSFVENLQPCFVRGEEDKGVTVDTRCAAAHLKNRLCGNLCSVPQLLAARMLKCQRYKPRIEIVTDILPGLRQGMDTAEITGLTEVSPKAHVELLHHFI